MKPGNPPSHGHTPEEERRIREAALDETLADSFPASDPPSTDPNPDNDEALDSSRGEIPTGDEPPKQPR
jgi:hypothetical protein